MATSDRKQPEAPIPNDLTRLCGMIACLSGSGAVGGAIGMARLKHLHGGQFFVAIVAGLIVGIFIIWAVWHVVYRVSFAVLRRKVTTSTLPWSRVLPVMYGVLLICFAVSGYLGALLMGFFIRYVLG